MMSFQAFRQKCCKALIVPLLAIKSSRQLCNIFGWQHEVLKSLKSEMLQRKGEVTFPGNRVADSSARDSDRTETMRSSKL